LAIEGERVLSWNSAAAAALGLHEPHLPFVFTAQEDVKKVLITAITPSWVRLWLEGGGGGVEDIGRKLKLQAHGLLDAGAQIPRGQSRPVAGRVGPPPVSPPPPLPPPPEPPSSGPCCGC
jgi:hypothetical protein